MTEMGRAAVEDSQFWRMCRGMQGTAGNRAGVAYVARL